MYSIVLTTTSTIAEAEKLASLLLEKKLAACVQVSQIKSLYTRKGTLAQESESQLMIKSKTSDYAAIEACILAHHTYETPEIIQIPITTGSSAYLSRINEVTL